MLVEVLDDGAAETHGAAALKNGKDLAVDGLERGASAGSDVPLGNRAFSDSESYAFP